MEHDTTMAQEDQTQNTSSGSGGGGGSGGIGSVGRSSKKPKQKKVPQRGLGVAQLEKIRLEEQQKRDAAAMLSSPCSVPSNKSSYLPLPIQNLHYSNQSPSSLIPLPSGSPADFRSPISLQHMMDGKVPTPSTVPLANSGGFEACWSSASASVHGNVPKLCGSQEHDFEKERFGVDPGLQFLPSLPFESNPIWPLPNLVQRTPPQYHQPSSSMVRHVYFFRSVMFLCSISMMGFSLGIFGHILFSWNKKGLVSGTCRWMSHQELHQHLCLIS